MLEQDHRHQVKQALAFHVERAPNRAVLDHAGKRIDFHAVGSAVTSVWLSRIMGRFEPLPLRRAMMFASGFVFEDLILDAVLIEDLLEEPGGFNLVARRVRSIDAQVLLHQLNRHVLVTRPVDPTILRSSDAVQNDDSQSYGQYPIHEFLY